LSRSENPEFKIQDEGISHKEFPLFYSEFWLLSSGFGGQGDFIEFTESIDSDMGLCV